MFNNSTGRSNEDCIEYLVTRPNDLRYKLLCQRPQYFNKKRVLDLGCGTGWMDIMLAEKMKPLVLVGVDKNARSISKARKALLRRLHLAENCASHRLMTVQEIMRFEIKVFKAQEKALREKMNTRGEKNVEEGEGDEKEAQDEIDLEYDVPDGSMDADSSDSSNSDYDPDESVVHVVDLTLPYKIKRREQKKAKKLRRRGKRLHSIVGNNDVYWERGKRRIGDSDDDDNNNDGDGVVSLSPEFVGENYVSRPNTEEESSWMMLDEEETTEDGASIDEVVKSLMHDMIHCVQFELSHNRPSFGRSVASPLAQSILDGLPSTDDESIDTGFRSLDDLFDVVGCRSWETLVMGYPASFSTTYGDIARMVNERKGVCSIQRVPTHARSIRKLVSNFPYNISFRCENWMDDPTVEETFDSVVCLSVTKPIHVEHGDSGLFKFFLRIRSSLKIGGVLLLEFHGCRSYWSKKAKSKTKRNVYARGYIDSHLPPGLNLECYPIDFIPWLTAPPSAEKGGFALVETLWPSPSRVPCIGWWRGIFVLQRVG